MSFEKGVAHIRDDRGASKIVAALPNSITAHAAKTPVAVADVRVSVSRLALWLWCPRRAAFAAWETEADTRSADRLQNDVPSQDGENAQSGVDVDESEVEVHRGSDSRALGTAVHAALETIFGSRDPFSPETEALAAERFTRELQREEAPDDPEMKRTFERALALARSEWGRRVLALNPEDRNVETPFRWRFDVNNLSHVTVIGQIDLLVRLKPNTWQVVDYKLAALTGKDANSESLIRYAWQAQLYALVAAEILNTDPKNVEPTLAFLREESVQPRSVDSMGHARISKETMKNVMNQYVEAYNCAQPLELSAQLWKPGDPTAIARSVEQCRQHECPFLSKCFRLTNNLN